MKIGFISLDNPNDSRAWSGIRYALFSKLQSAYDIAWVAPMGMHGLRRSLKLKFRQSSAQKYIDYIYFKTANIAYRLQGLNTKELFHKDYAWYYSAAFSRDISRGVQKSIEKGKYDILFAPHAISEIAFLETDIPIISMNDCTFAGMVGYYPHLSSLTDRNVREGNLIEQTALQKAAQIIYSSTWASDTAIKFYNADPAKLNVIHFGSNLTEVPERKVLKSHKSDKLRLLFVGVDWERKGGDVAVETVDALNARGIAAELTIIGCNPSVNSQNVRIIPFLNKNNEQERKELQNIFRESDFFLLPARAECAGIVFCEASAFGLPSIASDTGGIPDYVENNINGYRLPLSATGADYADIIQEIYSDEKRYRALRLSSRVKYEKDLNWDVWLEKFHDVVAKIKTAQK